MELPISISNDDDNGKNGTSASKRKIWYMQLIKVVFSYPLNSRLYWQLDPGMVFLLSPQSSTKCLYQTRGPSMHLHSHFSMF